MISKLRNELCQTVLGRCVWLVLLLTVGSWVISVIIQLVVAVFSLIAGIVGMIFGKGSDC